MATRMIGDASAPLSRQLAGPCLNLLVYSAYPRALRHYKLGIHRLPNVAFPADYHEKMFWRRVFDRNPDFIGFSDKLLTKELFRNAASDLFVPETLWSGTDPAEMPESLFRPDVVVKMASGVGRNWFMARSDARDEFVAAFRRWLQRRPTTSLGEWAYSQVTPMLFAERLVAPFGTSIDEFKVHLFGGEVFYTVVYVDEKKPRSLSAIFDADGRRLAVTNSVVKTDPSRALPAEYRLPDCYATAMQAARAIAGGTDYLRVDFMHFDGRLYGGEITVYPTAGLMTNSDREVMAEMGRRWDLRRSWFLSSPQTGWRKFYQGALWAHVEDTA
jgi:hypothetical protein